MSDGLSRLVLAAAGDRDARSIFATVASTLGLQLANLTGLIDPETIALGGRQPRWRRFWGPLRTAVEESLAPDSIPMPELVQSRLGGDACPHGAALTSLALYEAAPAIDRAHLSAGWPDRRRARDSL